MYSCFSISLQLIGCLHNTLQTQAVDLLGFCNCFCEKSLASGISTHFVHSNYSSSSCSWMKSGKHSSSPFHSVFFALFRAILGATYSHCLPSIFISIVTKSHHFFIPSRSRIWMTCTIATPTISTKRYSGRC